MSKIAMIIEKIGAESYAASQLFGALLEKLRTVDTNVFNLKLGWYERKPGQKLLEVSEEVLGSVREVLEELGWEDITNSSKKHGS